MKDIKNRQAQFASVKVLKPATTGKIMAGMFVLVQAASCSQNGQERRMERPNMIVIVADDLGWKDIGYHGSEIKTPVLDQMAKEGAIFDRFYVHSVCSPTRASLLTGRFPSRFGIYAPLGDEAGITAGTITIAELLRQNGYETAITGKWHLGAVPEARPLNYGFDSSYGYLRGQIDPYTHLYKNGDRTWHRNDSLLDEEGHATDLITAEAIRFIEKSRPRRKPFFLYLAYSVPHYPLDEPDEWMKEYDNRIENESRRKFAASVTHMDHSIGRILAVLQSKEMADNTLILFVSDNGGQKSWKSETEYNGKFEPHDVLGDNRPLREWKTWPYEGALRVPALLYWPGNLKHREITEQINVADVYPTLAYLAAAEIPEKLSVEGINFWPAVKGESFPSDRVMYWRMKNFSVLKKGDWKLIRFSNKAETEGNELYNVRLDPYEKTNEAGAHPEKVNELLKLLEEQMTLDKML